MIKGKVLRSHLDQLRKFYDWYMLIFFNIDLVNLNNLKYI
jgi:hypothetical protein